MEDIVEVGPNIASGESGAAIDTGVETKLVEEIQGILSLHRDTKVTARASAATLKDLAARLGEKLFVLKGQLARTGRSGSWSAYLRDIDLPRTTADRYIAKHEKAKSIAENRTTGAVSQEGHDDFEGALQTLLPRLKKLLTTAELTIDFVTRLSVELKFIEAKRTESGGLLMNKTGCGAVPVKNTGA